MVMSAVRFNNTYKSLAAVVQRTYTAVPVEGTWTASQIHAELVRTKGARDISSTKGCLKHLVEVSLVSEPSHGYFTRVPVKDSKTKTTCNEALHKEEAQPITEEIKVATPSTLSMAPKDKTKIDPIDHLTKLSVQVKDISFQLKNLANDIENAALEIAEEISSVDADTKKLEQLRSLLKGLV